MRKVIVAGSREFTNYDFVKDVMDTVANGDKIEIVSGGARGADSLGEQYSLEREFPLSIFPAEWGRYGRSAGFIRNEQMSDYADELCAFWDGRSKGTKHMIKLAREAGLEVRLFIHD